MKHADGVLPACLVTDAIFLKETGEIDQRNPKLRLPRISFSSNRNHMILSKFNIEEAADRNAHAGAILGPTDESRA